MSLVELRKKKGWSQALLAEQIGKSQSWVARLELGELDATPQEVARMAKVLDTTPEVISHALMEILA